MTEKPRYNDLKIRTRWEDNVKALVKTLVLAPVLLAALIASPIASAEDTYPSRPIRILVPSSPGAANDLITRILADGLSKLWGQSVIVVNVSGGGGSIAMLQASKEKPDGYTLLEGSMTFALQAALRDLPVDLLQAMQPVGKIGDAELVVVTGSRVPMKTIADIIRESSRQKLFVGGIGPGSSANMLANLVQDVTGAKWEEVNYKGTAEVLLDMAGGRIDVTVGSVPSTIASIKSGTAYPVAVMNNSRSSLLPDVPTLSEQGYRQATASIWYGIYAPAGTPPAIVQKINAGIAEVMKSPDMAEKFTRMGTTPSTMQVKEFTDFVKSEVDRWRDLAVKFKLIQ
jgi:tripartite-type tricarboxylate transporter receptor subunit TctC